jgi:hypothetical protein
MDFLCYYYCNHHYNIIILDIFFYYLFWCFFFQIGHVMDLNQEVFLEDKFDESSSESGSDQISITQSLDYDPKQLVLNIISDDDEINHEGNNNIYLNNMHPLFILYSNHL